MLPTHQPRFMLSTHHPTWYPARHRHMRQAALHAYARARNPRLARRSVGPLPPSPTRPAALADPRCVLPREGCPCGPEGVCLGDLECVSGTCKRAPQPPPAYPPGTGPEPLGTVDEFDPDKCVRYPAKYPGQCPPWPYMRFVGNIINDGVVVARACCFQSPCVRMKRPQWPHPPVELGPGIESHAPPCPSGMDIRHQIWDPWGLRQQICCPPGGRVTLPE
jgi:hypothetical protein